MKEKFKNDPSELGMKWFHFFYTFRVFTSIILSIPSFALSLVHPSYIIATIAYIIAAIYYYKHKNIGYYPMIMYRLTIVIFIFDIISLVVYNPASAGGYILFFFLPNLQYFKKRKHLFYSKNKTISQEENINETNTNILLLCESCKYNEYKFCRLTDTCKDCPNWNEDHCNCDEYEGNKIEECPYYVNININNNILVIPEQTKLEKEQSSEKNVERKQQGKKREEPDDVILESETPVEKTSILDAFDRELTNEDFKILIDALERRNEQLRKEVHHLEELLREEKKKNSRDTIDTDDPWDYLGPV